METGSVVEGFEAIEGKRLGFPTGGGGPPVEAFGFEGGEEAFHGGVVVRIAGAAHAGGEAVGAEEDAVIGTGILAAAITVMEPLPAAGTAEVWTFEVQYRYKDAPFGRISQPLELTVRGSWREAGGGGLFPPSRSCAAKRRDEG